MGTLSLLLDLLVTVLLAATLVYCVLLDRRLKALRSGHDGFRDVIAGLDRATERAQMSLTDLKTTGAPTLENLKLETAKAEKLIDELKLMVSSADRSADRLAGARRNVPAIAAPVAAPAERAPAQEPSSDILQQLRQAR